MIRTAVALLLCAAVSHAQPATAPGEVVLVVHGGAGAIRQSEMSPEKEREYRAALTESLEAGRQILVEGGAALDAVETAIKILEDSPLFNAGKGSVFTAEERNELDASIMDGTTRQAGAVAGVTTIKNPISAARAVMEKSRHVLLSGAGAERFAESVGLEVVEPTYFATPHRLEQLERARDREAQSASAEIETAHTEWTIGTVGALALDRQGRLAAGTSTGGMTNKRHGRIGDSPIVGAGTYATDRCAVSSTGHGEYFIRYAVAHDICARAAYTDQSVGEAAQQVVLEVLVEAGGSGGVIALDADGAVTMPFNSRGMFRGSVRGSEEPKTAIYSD